MSQLRTPYHSFLGQLGQELRESIQAGAALAALTVISGCGGGAVVSEGAGGSSANVAGNGAGVSPELEPPPPESIGCFGPAAAPHPGMLGFYGQCCFEQRCYTRPAGVACATDFASSPVRDLLRPGSATCACARSAEGHEAVAGPYAPVVETGSADPATRCCYVIGSIGCDGRPFIVAGVQRIAAAVARSDWGLAA